MMHVPSKKAPPLTGGKRDACIKWSDHWSVLNRRVEAKREGAASREMSDEPVPSNSTIRQFVGDLQDHEDKTGKKISVFDWFEMGGKRRRPPLPSVEDREWLQRHVVTRDARKDGMGGGEAISMIEVLGGCNKKKAANHCCCLVKNELLKDLKNNGRLVSAQKTTTSRVQAGVEGQLRFHSAVNEVWEMMERKNTPSPDFQNLRAHF
jgi:hypothetical protein